MDQRTVLPMLDAKCYGKSKAQVKELISSSSAGGFRMFGSKNLLQNNARCCILCFISGIVIQNYISSGAWGRVAKRDRVFSKRI